MTKETKTVNVEQVKSSAGRPGKTRATLKALGLGRIGKSRDVVVNAATVGMLSAVEHLIVVKEQ